MKKNKKYYNRYVFLSTFARNLIEVFIGTLLFKSGFSFKSVILYYLFVNIFSFILVFPYSYIAKKYSNKILAIMGVISFLILQASLNFVHINICFL